MSHKYTISVEDKVVFTQLTISIRSIVYAQGQICDVVSLDKPTTHKELFPFDDCFK